MKSFHLDIVTPDTECFSGDATCIMVRTTEGNVEILAGHADYLAKVATGECKLTTEQGTRLAAVSGGFISVEKGQVKLVSTTFEYAEDIDIGRARRAKEKAEAILAATKDIKEAELAKGKLMRAMARIDAAGKSKK